MASTDTSAAALLRERIADSIAVKQALLGDDAIVERIVEVAEHVARRLREGSKVIFCGNGGSAADATHLAAELVGRFVLERSPLPALALNDNISSVTAIANDYGYEHAFSRQLLGLAAPGDVLVALSTSGDSASVVAAVETANAAGLRTVAFTGAAGGRIAALADTCVRVPSTDTARVQEGTMLLAHVLCELVERALFAE